MIVPFCAFAMVSMPAKHPAHFSPQAKPSGSVKAPASFKQWSIVYVVTHPRTGQPSIWTSKGDGAGAKLVAKDGLSPVWSPDRKQLAFVRMRGVWVMNADGSDQRELYSAPGEDGRIVGLNWGKAPGSPSAEALFFGVYGQNQTDIYRIERGPKGFERAKLESIVLQWFGVSERAYPTVSPTGKTLAFTGNGDIWMSIWDEGKWRTGRIAPVAYYDMSAVTGANKTVVARKLSWVPGKRMLVYEYRRMWGVGAEELWLIDFTKARDPILDTDKVTRKRLAKDAMDPCVSPDGKWILATRRGTGKTLEEMSRGLVAISLDGSQTFRLILNGEQGNW